MSRSAIIASLVLHAGLLFLVGWRSSWIAARIGPGHAGADASFLADDAAGSLFTVPAPSSEPVAEPQLSEPALIPPAPAVVLSAPPIGVIAAAPASLPVPIAAAREMPATKLKLALSKGGKAAHRTLARTDGHSHDQGADGAGGGGGLHGGGYMPPQFLVRYKPLYPEEARAQRLEGTVLLLVSIDAAGHVTSTNIQRSCGHAVLDRAALAAVRAWRFDPARQDGVAIAARVEVPVRFRFEERSTARS